MWDDYDDDDADDNDFDCFDDCHYDTTATHSLYTHANTRGSCSLHVRPSQRSGAAVRKECRQHGEVVAIVVTCHSRAYTPLARACIDPDSSIYQHVAITFAQGRGLGFRVYGLWFTFYG